MERCWTLFSFLSEYEIEERCGVQSRVCCCLFIMPVKCVKKDLMAIIVCSCLLTKIGVEGCSETILVKMPLKCVKKRMVPSGC